MRIGFGLATGLAEGSGLRSAIGNIALEGLFNLGSDGKPTAWLAEGWTLSDDDLIARLRIRPGVTFHDGTPLTTAVVRAVLEESLPEYLGPAISDIATIEIVSGHELQFKLRRPSAFLQESLSFPIRRPGSEAPIGTGPFKVDLPAGEPLVMSAFDQHHEGKPTIEQINVMSYSSTRTAWAEMLRGDVDMLYEVGGEAIDFIEPTTTTRLYTFQRPYMHMVILNLARPVLRDGRIRRILNSAIDRDALIKEGLGGLGSPAFGPVSANHWANDSQAPRFQFDPSEVREIRGNPIRFTCLVSEPSQERLALLLQRQLRAIGVEMRLEQTTLDRAIDRARDGNFDAWLADVVHGPTLLRPYTFWHSEGQNNWGAFNSPAVDASLNSVRHATNDAEYRAGVSAFQRAIVDDPPAIFIAWSERARAVSTRFEVPVEPGRDILSTLRLWRPVGAAISDQN